MEKCRIILADDHEMLRTGLKSLLNQDSFCHVVGQAKDGEELMSRLRKIKCDLVVLDLSMPHMDGMTALEAIHDKYPKIKILVLTMQKDLEHFKHALSYGANGYLLKDDAFEQLIMGIKRIMKGKRFVSPSVADLIAERYIRSFDDAETPSLDILTKREKQILKYVALGLANKNIATKLKISIRTVEAHRAHLTDKLGIKTTAGLVKFAMSKGLI